MIPIIEDDYVDIEFGTGALKITPAHDTNDYEIGQRHGLPMIDSLDDDANLNDHGQHYAGKNRFEVRKLIAKELEESKIKHQDSFNSDWEAYAVILEEIQECEEELVKMNECLDVFWQRVRINDKNIDLGNLRQISVNLIQEASQVAANIVPLLCHFLQFRNME